MHHTVILLDVSGSMAEPVGQRRRIDVLADILGQVRPSAPPDTRVIAFASVVREVAPGDPLPEPGGGTDLRAALEYVARFRPARLIVITDGEPYDMDAALGAARALNCHIIAYYAGDERNHDAIAFITALAWSSGDGVGHSAVADLHDADALTHELKLLLAGPA